MPLDHHRNNRNRRLPWLACLPLALMLILPAHPGQAAERKARKAILKKVSASAEEAGEFANFSQWKDVAPFIDKMVEQHQFEREEMRAALAKVRFVEKAVQLVKPAPPGKRKNWHAYRARFVEPTRIQWGVDFWDRHADALARAQEQYGVPAEIIVGIIGVETSYGRNTGNFRVMDALATLAFAYPQTPNRAARMDYFRGELENVLLYAREERIDPFALLGSYAGAIGWPQFMPGSIRRYAIDFDGDRHIDLRGSPVDAIGSVANFLLEHGWTPGEPTAFPAAVTASDSWSDFLKQGLQALNRVDELAAAGVTPVTSLPIDLLYGLVDLQNGEQATEYWLGTNNFFAITKYNRSYFYAMSVIDLGKSVRVARGK
jgi:membrane-bound lytic murein transglycosylase B